MGGLKDVVDHQKGFGVFAWGVGETALQLEARVDGVRFEGEWISHEVLSGRA